MASNPALDFFASDEIEIYRQDQRDKNARGESLGLRKVATLNPVTGLNWVVNKHDTDNYDEDSSPAGQSKQNNILTSDRADGDTDIPFRSMDVVRFVATDEWFTISGKPKMRDKLLPYQRIYLTITLRPKIVAGDWNG